MSATDLTRASAVFVLCLSVYLVFLILSMLTQLYPSTIFLREEFSNKGEAVVSGVKFDKDITYGLEVKFRPFSVRATDLVHFGLVDEASGDEYYTHRLGYGAHETLTAFSFPAEYGSNCKDSFTTSTVPPTVNPRRIPVTLTYRVEIYYDQWGRESEDCSEDISRADYDATRQQTPGTVTSRTLLADDEILSIRLHRIPRTLWDLALPGVRWTFYLAFVMTLMLLGWLCVSLRTHSAMTSVAVVAESLILIMFLVVLEARQSFDDVPVFICYVVYQTISFGSAVHVTGIFLLARYRLSKAPEHTDFYHGNAFLDMIFMIHQRGRLAEQNAQVGPSDGRVENQRGGRSKPPRARKPKKKPQRGLSRYNEMGQSDRCPYFCPICMLYFEAVYKTSCCQQYICDECATGFCAGKNGLPHDLSHVPADLPDGVPCPFCMQDNVRFAVVKSGERVRKYEDSPSVANKLRPVTQATPGGTLTQPSPLKIGDTFEDMKRKMITFEQAGWIKPEHRGAEERAEEGRRSPNGPRIPKSPFRAPPRSGASLQGIPPLAATNSAARPPRHTAPRSASRSQPRVHGQHPPRYGHGGQGDEGYYGGDVTPRDVARHIRYDDEV